MEHPLRTARVAANLSMEALAQRVDVSKTTISRIESWKQDPSLALIRQLCSILPALTANDFIAPEVTQ
jgi:DNA-binding XRE family transcriptional regulator